MKKATKVIFPISTICIIVFLYITQIIKNRIKLFRLKQSGYNKILAHCCFVKILRSKSVIT